MWVARKSCLISQTWTGCRRICLGSYRATNFRTATPMPIYAMPSSTGSSFIKSEMGKQIIGATPWAAGPLVAWFPQALLYGFWQSHLGKKGAQTKHARGWVSEIVGLAAGGARNQSSGAEG